jgi:hypothetical protein
MYYKFVYADTYKKSQVKHAEPVAYVRADNYKTAKTEFDRFMRSDGIGIKSTKSCLLADLKVFKSIYYLR